MKIRLLLLIINLFLFLGLAAQDDFQDGINYQAVARDASGKALVNLPIQVQVSFTDDLTKKTTYYTEFHQAITDDQGHFELILGQGKVATGSMKGIPWAKNAIWLYTEVSSPIMPSFSTHSRAQLLSVPYAMFANSAEDLVITENLDARNHSVFWLTSGNTGTRPPIHFLGTRDNKELIFKTNGMERMKIAINGGQVITAGVFGPDNNSDNYPLYIDGSRQGIWVKVNGPRDGDNNFVTFADDSQIWGRIEGQTVPELLLTPKYILTNTLYILEGVKLGIGIANHISTASGLVTGASAATATIIFAYAAPGLIAAAVGEGLNAGALGAEAIALGLNAVSWNLNLTLNIGVAYSSGNGDYAEYLERAQNERALEAAEIIGVKAGLVSLNTDEADHLLVVSSAPIVLGNMPKPEVEDRFEKIAFMGQVPVKVAGKVEIGDYILPSGNHDGLGIAKNHQEMEIADYDKIVGVAWEAAANNPINYVLIGVGLQTNDLAPQVEKISKKIDNIVNYLEGKGPLRPEEGNSPVELAAQAKPMLFSNEEFDQFLDERSEEFLTFYKDAKGRMVQNNFDFDAVPGLEAFYDDPISGLKALRRSPELKSYWGTYDEYIKENFKKN